MSSDPKFLSAFRGAIEQMTGAFGWTESECRSIALALQEAITNKIRHAYHNRSDGIITFECCMRGGNMEFRVTDQGDPPDATKICVRVAGSATPGGLGTHIIRDVMDNVHYETSPEGNLLVLTRKLPEA